MAKRANGEGSLYFDEKKLLHRAMIVTPAGNRLTKSSKDEGVVKDWLNEQRLLIGRNLHVEPSTLTLSDWLTTYVETYSRPNVRQRSYERNKSLIYHCDSIGHIPIQKITPTHIRNLYNELEEEGFSGETRKKVHNLLNSAYKQAILNRYVQVSPIAAVKAPKVTREEIKIFTQKEIELILDVGKKFRLYPALLLAVTSGMRLGEVLGVRWRDIDLAKGIVHVRQNLQLTNQKGIIFEPPKTKKGKREIPIPPQTVKLLEKYKASWNESLLKHPISEEFKQKYPNATDLVFVSTTHTPIRPQNFSRRLWGRLMIDVEFAQNKLKINPMSTKEKLKVTLEKCRRNPEWKELEFRTFHSLRHTFATKLLSENVPIVDVSRVLGHAKVSTTLDIYGHAIPENSRLIAEKMSSFIK